MANTQFVFQLLLITSHFAPSFIWFLMTFQIAPSFPLIIAGQIFRRNVSLRLFCSYHAPNTIFSHLQHDELHLQPASLISFFSYASFCARSIACYTQILPPGAAIVLGNTGSCDVSALLELARRGWWRALLGH